MTRRVKPAPESQGYPLPASWITRGRLVAKKNHRKLAVIGGHARMLPAREWEAWARVLGMAARCSLGGTYRGSHCGFSPALTTDPVHVLALYYPPDRRWMLDLSGALEAIGDALELAGVIANDRQIRSWDGSRIMDPDPDGMGYLSVTVHRYLAEEQA